MTFTLIVTSLPWSKKFICAIREAGLLDVSVFWGRVAFQIDWGVW